MNNEYADLSKDLKDHDYELYFNYLLIPNNLASNIFLLINSFNLELDKSLNSSQEQMICLIRLQWWSDAIEAIYNNDIAKFKSPVVSYLNDLEIKKHLNKEFFTSLISAYQDEVEHKNTKDLDLTYNNLKKKNYIILKIMFTFLNLNIDDSIANDLAIVLSFKILITKKNYCTFFVNNKESLLSACKEVDNGLINIHNNYKSKDPTLKNITLFLPIAKSYIKKLTKLDYDIEKLSTNSIFKNQCLMLKARFI